MVEVFRCDNRRIQSCDRIKSKIFSSLTMIICSNCFDCRTTKLHIKNIYTSAVWCSTISDKNIKFTHNFRSTVLLIKKPWGERTWYTKNRKILVNSQNPSCDSLKFRRWRSLATCVHHSRIRCITSYGIAQKHETFLKPSKWLMILRKSRMASYFITKHYSPYDSDVTVVRRFANAIVDLMSPSCAKNMNGAFRIVKRCSRAWT